MYLAEQYNSFAYQFSTTHDDETNSNRDNRKTFYQHIDFIHSETKLLDLACGDGLDLSYYKKFTNHLYGLDASAELVKIAQQKNPGANIQVGLFESIPFADNYFDVVVSKYAIQTSRNLNPIISEIHRILKPGGVMMYLVTHPFRQYFEKKDPTADYFEQRIVDCNILNNTILIKEPTHTLNEYLNDFLFKNFDVQLFEEHWDAAAEKIDGRKYPGYFILKAKKR